MQANPSMKFQFFGRTPSLNASVVSDTSSFHESEPSHNSSIDRRTSIGANDEADTMISTFEWDQSMGSSQIGKAVSTVSTICSMIQSEQCGSVYDPLNKHMYTVDESKHHGTSVDEKCRSKMLEWCFKVRYVFVAMTLHPTTVYCLLKP